MGFGEEEGRLIRLLMFQSSEGEMRKMRDRNEANQGLRISICDASAPFIWSSHDLCRSHPALFSFFSSISSFHISPSDGKVSDGELMTPLDVHISSSVHLLLTFPALLLLIFLVIQTQGQQPVSISDWTLSTPL